MRHAPKEAVLRDRGLTVSADGRYLYIADGSAADGTAHHRIRRLDLPSVAP